MAGSDSILELTSVDDQATALSPIQPPTQVETADIVKCQCWSCNTKRGPGKYAYIGEQRAAHG